MEYDKIKLEVFRNIFQSICDEMGNTLRMSAFSPNIKERNDFSCALFLPNGESFAFGSHIPVHLGSMPLSVMTAIKRFRFFKGDIIIMNDPYKGGTHLPDITLISPFFHDRKLEFFIASRAHHSDIGGMEPGSMPLAKEIYQEGLIIPPSKLYNKGKLSEDIMNIILSNTRTPNEREGDINAQISALNRGRERLESTIAYYGLDETIYYAKGVIEYADQLFRIFLNNLPQGSHSFTDYLDDDGFNHKKIEIRLKVTLLDDSIVFDFSGTSPAVPGNINANKAVTYSSILFSLVSLFSAQVPINSGIMRAVSIIDSPGTITDARRPSAVAGGNVETSQRITDVILGALSMCPLLEIPSASQGTMNNISIGGIDYNGEIFTYYETIGGGTGAYDKYSGISAVHSHMTNSLNTPVEVIESNIPVKINKYSIRKNSGGNGRYKGGNGIIREYECMSDLSISILSERRIIPPYGLSGGSPGKTGQNLLIKNRKKTILPSKINLRAEKSDIIQIKTPGGGGYGRT